MPRVAEGCDRQRNAARFSINDDDDDDDDDDDGEDEDGSATLRVGGKQFIKRRPLWTTALGMAA